MSWETQGQMAPAGLHISLEEQGKALVLSQLQEMFVLHLHPLTEVEGCCTCLQKLNSQPCHAPAGVPLSNHKHEAELLQEG